MKLLRMQMRGFTTIRGTVSLEIPGAGLVAFVGRNGAGKSTLLEAAAVAAYKVFPSRGGSLYDWAHGKDAFVYAAFEDEHGREIACTVKVDAEAKRTESYIMEDGRPLTTGRAAEFDDQVRLRFGSYELLLASVFAAQGKEGNFLMMPKALRKGLFAELLGLQYLEGLSEGAKLQRTRAEALAGQNLEQTQNLKDAIASMGDPAAAVEQAVAEEERFGRQLEAARGQETAAVAALERGRAAGEHLERLRVAAMEAKDAGDEAEEALERAEALGPAAHDEDARHRKERAMRAERLAAQSLRAMETHQATVRRLETRREIVNRHLAEGPALEKLAATGDGLEAELSEAKARERESVNALSVVHLRRQEVGWVQENRAAAVTRAVAETERLQKQAGLLKKAPCTAAERWYDTATEGHDLAGACPLLAEARAAKGKTGEVEPDWQEKEDAAVAALQAAEERHQGLALALDPHRAQELEKLLWDAREARTRLGDLERSREELRGLGALEDAAKATLGGDMRAVEEARLGLEKESQEADKALQAALDVAADVALKYRGRAKEAARRLDAAAAAVKAAGTIPSLSLLETDLSTARDGRYTAEKLLRQADVEVANARARLETFHKADAQLVDLCSIFNRATNDVGDWTLLEQAFGKNGIQALEIDAAGPEVADIANDLLAVGYADSRFRISFETLREKKSAKGEFSEVFEVQVYDSKRSGVTPIEGLSGGEKIVVGEAVGLALSIFNARRSGVRWRTLFRDETAGALDPESAQAYVDMLRRALALGGFAQVLFISHSPEVWERADARVFVEDGRVRVDAAEAPEEVSA